MNENDRLRELIWKNELLEERVQRLEAEKEILQMKLEKSKNLPTFHGWPYTDFLNSTCDITQSFEKFKKNNPSITPVVWCSTCHSCTKELKEGLEEGEKFKKNNPSITPDFKDALDAMVKGLKEGLEEGEKMAEKKEEKKLDWEAAEKHLNDYIRTFDGRGGVLQMTIMSLRSRFEKGERTEDLYSEIMELD